MICAHVILVNYLFLSHWHILSPRRYQSLIVSGPTRQHGWNFCFHDAWLRFWSIGTVWWKFV